MNKAERAKLVGAVDKLDKEFHGADGERKAEIIEERRGLLDRSDVAEALGVEAAERGERERVLSASQELSVRAFAAGVDPVDLALADNAILGELTVRSELDANAQVFRQLLYFVRASAPSTVGYNFAIATAFVAGREAAK